MNQSKADQVYHFVQHRISGLVHTYNKPMVGTTLARLRRGIGKPPGSLPELWDITLDGLSENLQRKDEHPSYGEWAVYTALTLFALHQQGKDIKTQCMHVPDASLGQAIRQMIRRNPEREESIKRRFMATVTSDSYEELTWHLRGLIQLLRAEEIKLDYPWLAKDLYRFQFTDNRDRIRLQWGRDFYWQPIEQKLDSNLEIQDEEEVSNV